MKRLLVVATLAALLVLSPGCSKSKSDGNAQDTSAESSSRQETAWKVGAEKADAAPTEVRASPHPELPPSSLPMAADGSEGGASKIHVLPAASLVVTVRAAVSIRSMVPA